MKREVKSYDFRCPVLQISAFKFICTVSPKQSTDKKNRRDILLRDKIEFQDCILATVFVYIGSRKGNKRKVNTRNFASD